MIDSTENDRVNFQFAAALTALPNTTVSYSSPFAYNYPLTPYCVPPTTIKCSPNILLNPPRGTYLDSITGDFIFTPTKCDEFPIIVIEATEYRKDTSGNWVWIGKTRRENTFFVKDDCGYNKSPIISGTFNNSVCAGDKICIKYKITDNTFTPYQTTRDTVTTAWTSPISALKITETNDTGLNIKNVEFCWQTKASDARDYPYVFSIEGADGHCPKQAISSRGITITVKGADTAGFTSNLGPCNSIIFQGYIEKKTSSNVSYFWTLTDTSNPKNVFYNGKQKSSFSNLKPGVYSLKMSVNSDYLCYPDVVKLIRISTPLPLVQIGRDTSVCPNNPVTANAAIKNAKSPYTYAWKVNDNGISNATTKNITYNAVKSKFAIVSLTVTDSNLCTMMDTMLIFKFNVDTVLWQKNPLQSKCWSTGDFKLQNLLLRPDSAAQKKGTLRIWGSLTAYGKTGLVDSTGKNNFIFRTSKINNATELQSGKNVTEKIYVWFRDSNGCSSNTVSVNQRINGNPIVDVIDTSLCQSTGYFTLDAAVIRPKVKFGAIQTWVSTLAPGGVNKNDIIIDNSGGAGTDWWFVFGNPGETKYIGTYKFNFTVTDQLTGCYTKDSNVIKVKGPTVLTPNTDSGFCASDKYFNLLNLFKADGNSPSANKSTFAIYSFNGSTDTKTWGGASIYQGNYFSGKNKVGKWVFTVSNSENGCATNSQFILNIYPKPLANFTTTPADTALITSPTFTTTNNSTITPNSTLNYQWFYDWNSKIVSSTAFEPSISYPSAAVTYTCKLVAISDKGCTDTFTKILVVGKGNAAIYNFHTSAFLKLNNQFKILNDLILLNKLRVFDLTGKTIFETTKNSGIILTNGVYPFEIEYIFQNRLYILRGRQQISN
jgi:hypothetical protein